MMPFTHGCSVRVLLDASPSVSESNPNTYTQTNSVQGASGASSPTITGGGNVTVNNTDSDVANTAITKAAEEVEAALSGAGSIAKSSVDSLNQTTSAVNAGTQQSEQTIAELLDQVLQGNTALAQYQGSGGTLNANTQKTTTYLVIGGLGLFGLIVLVLLGKKN